MQGAMITPKNEFDVKQIIKPYLPGDKTVLKCDKCRYPFNRFANDEKLIKELKVMGIMLPEQGAKPPKLIEGGSCPSHCNGKIQRSTDESTARAMLLDGFDVIRRRRELSDAQGLDFNYDEMECWIDGVITQRMGGTRVGDTIIWRLDDGVFIFDPFSGDLTHDSQ